MELPLPGTWEPATLRDLLDRAGRDLGTPWPVPTASGYARLHRDGNRDAYEQLIWEREYRVSRAAIAAAHLGTDRWIDEAADGVLLLCEQSSWCWPAHDDTPGVLPDVTAPYLDLGAGEVAAQLAWIDRLLAGAFDTRYPGLRARIRHEVDQRVLVPFETRDDFQWLDGRNNWSAWIHGNLLVAAIQLVPPSARRERLIERIAQGLSRYAAGLPADGAVDEGFSYWWFGVANLLEAYDLLGVDVPVALVEFPHRVHLGGPWYLNHADGQARPPATMPWHVLHRAARKAGSAAAAAHAAAHRRPGEPIADETPGLGRLLRAVGDREWIAAVPGESPLPRRTWFPSTQVLLVRPVAGSAAGLTLAVKGGHNDEEHNHNDVGSVVVAVDGVPALIDPGRPTYTRQTFGPDRYDIWTMRSAWHNTPTIRGVQQSPGRSCAATLLDVGDTSISFDLAAAYPQSGVVRWIREARLDSTVTVTDSWELADGPDGATLVHWIVAGPLEVGDGYATNGTVTLSWTPAVPASTTVRELDDPMLSDVWGPMLTRLDIDVSPLGAVGTLTVSVRS